MWITEICLPSIIISVENIIYKETVKQQYVLNIEGSFLISFGSSIQSVLSLSFIYYL